MKINLSGQLSLSTYNETRSQHCTKIILLSIGAETMFILTPSSYCTQIVSLVLGPETKLSGIYDSTVPRLFNIWPCLGPALNLQSRAKMGLNERRTIFEHHIMINQHTCTCRKFCIFYRGGQNIQKCAGLFFSQSWCLKFFYSNLIQAHSKPFNQVLK